MTVPNTFATQPAGNVPASQLDANFAAVLPLTGGTLTGALAGTTLALGGATIGSDALSVTGSVQASTTVTANTAVRSAATGEFNFVNRGRIFSPADGVIQLGNWANSDFSRLQFGGTTSSFPSIKRNSTALNFRLADDSADAPITAAAATFSGAISGTGNLAFSATAQRITGDMSNSTHTNRLIFQSSTVNGATTISAIPNGSGTVGQLNLYSLSDPDNSHFARLAALTGEVRLSSEARGTGTYQPITFYASGAEKMRLDTSALTLSVPLTVPGVTTAALTSTGTFTSGAGAQVGTLTNAPAVGNPTTWIKIIDNGVTRYIPAW